jgi:aspartokinase-like uncharacterized kinase
MKATIPVDGNSSVVVKVGGSLHDLPQLGDCLRRWLEDLPTRRVLLIPGGGLAANWIRTVDRLDHLGEELSHWLALRALSLVAEVLAARLGSAKVIVNIEDRESAWHAALAPVLDIYGFARADEMRPDHLPHRWDVTSDALAARAAVVAGMPALILLKSVSLPAGCDWPEAARQGIVDPIFPEVVAAAGGRLKVTAINFRQWCLASSAAAPRENTP